MKKGAVTKFAIIRTLSAIMLLPISILATLSLISFHQGIAATCVYEVPSGSVVNPSAGTVAFPNGTVVATGELHCSMSSVIWQSVGIAAIERYLSIALVIVAAVLLLCFTARRRFRHIRKRKPVLLVAGVFILFFFIPVVPTYLIPCLVGPPLDYASLSNHFFSVGAVYLPVQGSFGSYQFWTHGAVFCF